MNPVVVGRMLSQLKVLLEDVKPTATLCLAMMEKLNAEEKLLLKVDEVKKAIKSAPPPQPAPVKTRAVSPSRTSTSAASNGSWEAVGTSLTKDPKNLEIIHEMEKHLTDQEKLELFQMLKERKAKSFEDGIMTPITESQ